MIRGALAPDSHEDLASGKLKTPGVVLAEVALERFEELKTVRVLLDHDLRLGLRFRHRCGIERRAAGGEALWRKVLSAWGAELELFAGGKRDRVCHGVEAEFTGESHSSDNSGRSKEIHRLAVAVVPGLEITVCDWIR